MTDPNEQEIQPPQNIEVPGQLPLLPVRDIVVFPYMVLPLLSDATCPSRPSKRPLPAIG